MSLRVRDVMTSARWTVDATCRLPEAARLMRSWDAHEVFVVDHGRLCGVLNDTDITVTAIASERPPSTLTAGECQRTDPPRLLADQPLADALAYARRHRLRRLPVVDRDQFVGVAWTNDLERATSAEQPAS